MNKEQKNLMAFKKYLQKFVCLKESRQNKILKRVKAQNLELYKFLRMARDLSANDFKNLLVQLEGESNLCL